MAAGSAWVPGPCGTMSHAGTRGRPGGAHDAARGDVGVIAEGPHVLVRGVAAVTWDARSGEYEKHGHEQLVILPLSRSSVQRTRPSFADVVCTVCAM